MISCSFRTFEDLKIGLVCSQLSENIKSLVHFFLKNKNLRIFCDVKVETLEPYNIYNWKRF